MDPITIWRDSRCAAPIGPIGRLRLLSLLGHCLERQFQANCHDRVDLCHTADFATDQSTRSVKNGHRERIASTSIWRLKVRCGVCVLFLRSSLCVLLVSSINLHDRDNRLHTRADSRTSTAENAFRAANSVRRTEPAPNVSRAVPPPPRQPLAQQCNEAV